MLKRVRFLLVAIGFPTVGLAGLIFNFIVIVLFCKRPYIRRKLPNILLFNQALVDLFNCAIFCPMYTCNAVLYYYGGRTVYIRIVSNTFQQLSYMSSILNLLPLALDRCFAISAPLRHRRFVTRRVVLVSIALVWFVSLCIACVYGYIVDQTYIRDMHNDHLNNFYFAFTVIHLAVFILVIIVYAFTYYKSRKAVHHNCRIAVVRDPNCTAEDIRIQKEQKLLRMFMAIFVVFFVAFSPGLVFFMLLNFAGMKFTQVMDVVDASSVIGMAVSSVVNPVLTLFMKDDFRVKWSCCCFSNNSHMDRATSTITVTSHAGCECDSIEISTRDL